MKNVIDQLNQWPALRLGALMLTILCSITGASWYMSGIFHETVAKLDLIAYRLAAQETALVENKAAIALNTEHRLKREGADLEK